MKEESYADSNWNGDAWRGKATDRGPDERGTKDGVQVISTAGHKILEEVSIRMRPNDIRTRCVPVLRIEMLKIRGYYTFITAVLGETSLPCNL
jgi:hypothetical protein